MLALVACFDEINPPVSSKNMGFFFYDETKEEMYIEVTENENNLLVEPNTPRRKGYEFDDWFTEESEIFDFSKPIDKSISIYAKWLDNRTLPEMHINLFDKNDKVININSVNRAEYVNGTISLKNTKTKYLIEEAKTEFRGRGNGSWAEAKKGYRIKFDKKQPLFGEEASKHWAIIACSNLDDRTLMKNAIAFGLAREIFSDIGYTTSTRWIDTYINGSYYGVYLLTEHVRVDKGRVDIESDYGVLDTGYLIEYDGYGDFDSTTNTFLTQGLHYFRVPGMRYPFTVKSPDPEDYAEEVSLDQYKAQVEFIKDYTTKVYNAGLSKNFEAFRTFTDVDSFVDMYILNEYFKNTDIGWSSFFMYKKPGGKLFCGPAWDFDYTAGASRGDSGYTGIYVANTVQTLANYGANELLIALYNTKEFKDLVVKRWNELSADIKKYVNEAISTNFVADKTTVMARNFILWKNQGVIEAERAWVNKTNELKSWLMSRASWLDSEWKE